jgi:hypothetical protein
MKKHICPHCKLEMEQKAWGKFSSVLICYVCNYFIDDEGEEKALDEI